MQWERNTDAGFWVEAFQKVDRLDSLQLLFGAWWTFFRDRCPDQEAVVRAKNKRKAELGG